MLPLGESPLSKQERSGSDHQSTGGIQLFCQNGPQSGSSPASRSRSGPSFQNPHPVVSFSKTFLNLEIIHQRRKKKKHVTSPRPTRVISNSFKFVLIQPPITPRKDTLFNNVFKFMVRNKINMLKKPPAWSWHLQLWVGQCDCEPVPLR